MSEPAPCDTVRFHRPRLVPGVELVSAQYCERRFPEHSHAERVVGAVVGGAETLTVSGRSHLVDAGRVLLLNPDQTHANATVGPDVLHYDVLYLGKEAISPFLAHEDDEIGFAAPVRDDAALFATVSGAHAILRNTAAGRLEQESALGALVQALIAITPDCQDMARSAGPYPDAIAVAKAYIDRHYADGFGLYDLAALTGLSVFHFTRRFKQTVGLSPLAYRNGRRVAEARVRLLDGVPIAQLALDLGYADQSHLTRQFQRIVGVSPRRYAQQ